MGNVESNWSNLRENTADAPPAAWISIGISLSVLALIQVYRLMREFEARNLPIVHLASFDRVEGVAMPPDFSDEVMHVENIGEIYDRDDLEVQEILNRGNVRPEFEPELIRQFHNEEEDAILNQEIERSFMRQFRNEEEEELPMHGAQYEH